MEGYATVLATHAMKITKITILHNLQSTIYITANTLILLLSIVIV